MTTIADLNTSITEMSDEELHARIRHLRISRTTQPPAAERKSPKKKPPIINAASIDPAKMSRESAASLLALLEAAMEDE